MNRLLVILLLVGCIQLKAQIAFDAVGSENSGTSANTKSWTHECAGSNRYIFYGVGLGSQTVVDSVKYDGVKLTQLEVLDGSGLHMALWGLKNPASGSNTMQAWFAANCYTANVSVSYSGVDQTTPLGTVVEQYSTPAAATDSIIVGSDVDDLAVAFFMGGYGYSFTPTGSGQTERVEVGIADGEYSSFNDMPGAETQTVLKGTWSGSQVRGVIGVALKPAAVAAQLTISAVPTFENCGYYIHYPDSTGVVCKMYYKHTDSSSWKQAYTPYFASTHALDGDTTEFRGSITGLSDSTTYNLWAVILTGTDTTAQGDTTFTTWDDTPPILRTHNLADIYESGAWGLADTTGTANGWIRILGDDETVIDGGAAYQAVLLSNLHYVIFENIHVTGGDEWGVYIYESDHIRFINCDISGWGKATDHLGADGYHDSGDNLIQLDHGLLCIWVDDLVIERCRIHDQNGNAAIYNPPQIQNGASGVTIGACARVVIRYNDITGSESHWYEDCVKTLAYDVSEVSCEGFYRDSDIYGNLFSFANDDGIECEGDGLNVRVYKNFVTHAFSGMSDAPCTRGPVYFFRNTMMQVGDSNWYCHPALKMGGGTTWSTGRAFWFHNTFIGHNNILCGVGYGNDGEGVKEKFLGTSRNNIFWAIGSEYTWAIDDPYEYAESSSVNDFDYDMLLEAIRAKPGSEAHGTYSAPAWTDTSKRILTLQSGSPAIDSGEVLLNFSDGYAGGGPDMGAFEYGSLGMIPYRPLGITSDRYHLTGSSGATVTLTSTALDSTLTYTIKKDSLSSWLTVSPSSGSIASSETEILTVSSSDGAKRAVFLVEFENGYSIPISVSLLSGSPPEGGSSIRRRRLVY